MSDVNESELFSAYLDGELTADEQVRVEQILATSPEARQLLDELRALGSTLQGLPQEKLDEDLAARVLQIAERRMLAPEEADESDLADKPVAGRAAAALTRSAADASESEGFPWREISWRGILNPRALIWSAVIVVVAVVIHYTAPPPANPNRQQARLDDNKPTAGAAAETRPKSTSDGAWVGPANQPKPSDEMQAKREERRDAIDKTETNAKTGPIAKDIGDKETIAKAETAPAAASDGRDLKKAEAKPEADRSKSRPDELHKYAMKAIQPDSSPKKAAGKDAARELGYGAHDQGFARRSEEKKELPPRESFAGNKPAPAEPLAAKPGAAAAVAPVPPAAPASAVAKSDEAARVFRDTPVQTAIVVHLNVSTTAFRGRLFDELLVRNGLAAGESSEGGQAVAVPVRNVQAGNTALTAGGSQAPLSGSVSTGGSTRQQVVAQAPADVERTQPQIVQNSASRAAPPMRAGAAGGGRPASLYYEFDASPAQLHALLAEIGEQTEAFSSPEVASSLTDTKRKNAGPAKGEQGFADDQSGGFGQANGAGSGQTVQMPWRGKQQSKAGAESRATDKLREQATHSQAADGAGELAYSQSVVAPEAAAATKTHVVVLLSVVDRVAPPPAPAAAPSPAAPAKGK